MGTREINRIGPLRHSAGIKNPISAAVYDARRDTEDLCGLDFDLEAKNNFLDFVVAGGIVFRKHTLSFYSFIQLPYTWSLRTWKVL